LNTLCFHLKVDYEDLSGVGKEDKARELVLFLERRQRIVDLMETGKRLRPEVPWGEI